MSKANQQKIYLIVTAGPHKGEKHRLENKSIIGRSEQANICLTKDNRISRQHAVIIYANNSLYIKNLSKNNKLFVNKKAVKESKIKVTDKITAGSSQFQIHISKVKKQAKPQIQYDYQPKQKASKSKKRGGLNPVRTMLVLAIACGAYLYFNKKDGQIERDISAVEETESTDTADEKIKVISRRTKFTKPKKEADILAKSEYIIGFRDFKKGQYARSLLHFTNCLNYKPNHDLCNRYLSLAQKKIDEMIQYQTITGRKFLDQKQYNACISSFRNIAFLIQDKSDQRYAEAIENEKFCKQMLEESF